MYNVKHIEESIEHLNISVLTTGFCIEKLKRKSAIVTKLKEDLLSECGSNLISLKAGFLEVEDLLNRRITRNFSGQGRFLKIRALR